MRKCGDPGQILDLIQAIYRQPGSAEQWDFILGELAKTFRLLNQTVVEYDVQTRDSKTLLHRDVPLQYLEQYSSYYSKINTTFREAKLPTAPGQVGIGHEMIVVEDWYKTRIYNEFFRPQGSRHFLVALLAGSPLRVVMLSAQRDKETGPFSANDKRLMELIAPHLANRIDLEKRFEQANHANQSLDLALESHRTACVLLNGKLRAAFANPQAERILAEGDGLSLTREGRLTTSLPRFTACLRNALVHAQAICSGQGLTDPGLVRIERPSGKQAYLVLVRPCPLSGRWTAEPAGVLVIINDPEDLQRNLSSALINLFSLTEAEAEVAELLMKGLSSDRIAAARSVSLNTIRSQIKSCLDKTHTSSQVAFVALVYRTLGSILG